ncbi:Mu transposase C-terminal domain-containing protein [Bacillus sp. JJ664]
MLLQQEFTKWCKDNMISDKAKEEINLIRTSPPNRKVQSSKGNVSGNYASKKMGVTIQFESRTVELAAVYQMEHDINVFEFYDQPKEGVFLNYLSKNGRKVSVNSTPDFFVIRENEAGWEEWKTEEELEKLAKESPNRYVKKNDGSWSCPPGEEYAKKFGLKFYLRSSKSLNRTYLRNITFLEDYINYSDSIELDQEIINQILDLVSTKYGITINEILNKTNDINHEEIYIMIVKSIVYVDINKYLLVEDKNTPVFLNKKLAQIYEEANLTKFAPLHQIRPLELELGSKLLWDGNLFTVANLGINNISLISTENRLINLTEENIRTLILNNTIELIENDVIIDHQEELRSSIMESASPKDIEEANNRYRIILEFEAGVEITEVSNKTVSRWLKSYNEAEKLYGNGFLGLFSRKKNRGNRKNKLPDATINLINEMIETQYENIKQKNKRVVYGSLINECEKREIIVPSYTTFLSYIDKKPIYELINSRKGKRAAYKYEEWFLGIESPRHGDRPFEICHIDHTELDIELVLLSGSEKVTHRPYLTVLMDAYSRKVLAHYITFDDPSYRSNMMVIRECVRKYNRLPQNLIVDGGKDFNSKYFDFLCARFMITKLVRPPAEPKYGSVLERLFGTTNTTLIHNLQGNTQLTKEVRIVTKGNNPKNLAIWSLEDLNEAFYQWLDNVYEQSTHLTLGVSPCKQFEIGMAIGGKREFKYIPYNEEFKIATLPDTPYVEHKVQPGRGIVFLNVWYWHSDFKSPKVENTKVPVRYDPFNIGIVYTFVKGRWVQCISEYHSLLKGKSEKELKIITAEIRKRNKSANKSKNVNASQIAAFINLLEENEKLMDQKLKDSQSEEVRERINSPSDLENENLSKKHNLIENTPNSEKKKPELNMFDIPEFDYFEG